MANELGFSIDTRAVEARLLEEGRRVRGELDKAMYHEGLEVAKVSVERTPYKTGALRGSTETEKPRWAGRDISVTISVGGPAAPYAPHVHYNLMAFHEHGGPLFLQSAALDAAPGLPNRLAERLGIGGR